MKNQSQENTDSNYMKPAAEEKSKETEYNTPLAQHAQAVVDQLNYGNPAGAMNSINELVKARDLSIFNEVGKLTRSLHTALRDFKIEDIDSNINQQDEHKVAGAADRLNYIITKTESAANKTLDKAEDAAPISKELGHRAKQIKKDIQDLDLNELSSDELKEFHSKIYSFLEHTFSETALIDGCLSEIIIAQDFQDLTGQVINKIMKLLHNVEGNLISLVKMASNIESFTGVDKEKSSSEEYESKQKRSDFDDGPCVNSEERDDVMSSQDDVDDLLSSLGF